MEAAWAGLCLVPQAIIILAAPTVLYGHAQKPVCVIKDIDSHLESKLITGCIVAATALGDAALSLLGGETIHFSFCISFLATFSLTWILYVEHKHSPHPFTLVSFFLAFEIISSLASWLDIIVLTADPNVGRSLLATLTLLAKMYILILHEKSNWMNLSTDVSAMLDQEETYGFWSRCFSVSLFHQVTWIARDQPAIININWKIPEFMESLRVRKFSTSWDKNTVSNLRLLRACASGVKQELVFAFISVLFTIPFKLAVPFWAEALIHYAQHRRTTSKPDTSTATPEPVLIFGTCVVLFGFLISRACSRYAIGALKLGIRTVVGKAVFMKLQKRPSAEVSRLLKLSIISDDIPAIEQSAELFLRCFGFGMEILFSIYFIRRESTVIACLLTIHVAILAIPVRSRAVSFTVAASKASDLLEQRADAMATTLLSMKGAKALGCTMVMEQTVQKLRSSEKDAYQESRKAYIKPQIMQVSLTAWSVMYVFAGDFFSAVHTSSSSSVFKCGLLLLIFFDATAWLLVDIFEFSTVRKSVIRLQKLLQQSSYELDAHYTAVKDDNSAPAVLFSGATLSSEPGRDPLLDNINMPFIRGTLTIITGSEKRSALAQAAIGNCTITQGVVQMGCNSMSYCGKDIWVQRRSIRDNIIGSCRFQDAWYSRVIRACCLDEVIEELPGGNDHVVETTTKRLDSSQLQRLALARSVYSLTDVIVLDDVLSYQDAATSATIRHNLFSHGGLLRHGSTVLVATNDWQAFLNMGAHFVNVESNGQVSRTTQANLLATLAAETAMEAGADMTKQLKRDLLAGSANQLMTQDLLSNIRNEQPPANKIEQASLLKYLGNDGIKPFCLSLAAMVIFIVLENTDGFLILNWMLASKPAVSMYLGIGIIGGALAGPFFALSYWLMLADVGHRRGDAIHETLTKTVFGATYGFFRNENIDRASRVACEGFKTLNYGLPRSLIFVSYNILALTTNILIAFYPSPAAFPMIVLGGLIIYAFHAFQYPVWHTLIRLEAEARRILQKHFVETATGSAHIRALGWETRHALQTQRYIDRYQQTAARLHSLERFILFFSDFLRIIWMASCVFAGLYFDIDPSRLGFILYLSFCMSSLIEYLLNGTNSLRNDLAVLNEVEDFVDTTPQEEERVVVPLPDRLPVSGDIRLQDAAFGYESTGAHTLSDVNLRIPAGLELGVHGPGECGKSALFLVLCGVLPYSGSITIDGREIRNISPTRLADIFTVIPETPVVIPGATVLQMLFPPDFLKPGRLDAHMPIIELLIYRLGLEDLIKEVGGFNGKFEDLYLTSDQMHVFSLARALVKFTFNRDSVFLIDDIMSKVSLETYNLMSGLMTSLFGPATNTVIMLFDNHLFPMLEPTRFARIEDGRVQELDLTNAPDNGQ